MKHHAASILLVSLCAACASKAPDPQPDPAQLQRLLATLDAQSSAPSRADDATEAGVPLNFDDTVRKADRILPVLKKVPTDTLDPSLAAALLDG